MESVNCDQDVFNRRSLEAELFSVSSFMQCNTGKGRWWLCAPPAWASNCSSAGKFGHELCEHEHWISC
eukprot:1244562-Amphidinium_carterae.1